jgi:molecular chaperone DnaK
MGEIVLVDVTPLTLGVETLGGIADLTDRTRHPDPPRRSELFTTAADMQTSVTIHIFQGERPMAADNASLGQFTLDGLAGAARHPKDRGHLRHRCERHPGCHCQGHGDQQSISRITGSTRLSEEEKRRMIEGAERHAEEDRRRREQAEQLNAADAVCYQASACSPTSARSSLTSSARALRRPCATRGGGDETRCQRGDCTMETLKRLLQEAG